MGFHILINGVTSERELVAQVIELMQHPAQGMAQGLSLRGLSGLLSKSSLLVANDSGPLHLADALCVTTVSLFWCSNYFTSGPTRCSGHYPLLSWRMNCPVCGKHCVYDSCDHKESFIADISVDEVLSQCKRALESDFSALQKDGSQPNLPSV
jgi:ADP-heptose:LPS heptosyltransferase